MSVDVDVVVEGYNNRLAVVEDMSMRNSRGTSTAAIATTYDENDTTNLTIRYNFKKLLLLSK